MTSIGKPIKTEGPKKVPAQAPSKPAQRPIAVPNWPKVPVKVPQKVGG